MDMIAAWCGFVGAWVLVAGPVYQGTVEMSGVTRVRSAVRTQAQDVAHPERVSPWWWLLPPVAYVMTHRKESAWQQQVMASLTPEQRTEFLALSNKGAGWFMVGSGAMLIGFKEAVELVEILHWPPPTALALVLLAAGAALGYTVYRVHLTQQTLHVSETHH
ncbi:hypothetical protein ACIQM4_28485 [Streptomyces sp. NPDC091272]|uniref:hypothetical protein n=1 Tax=Streptomyces sp. NPDC091272 TaxID=3365981 RepID=UPI003809E2F3